MAVTIFERTEKKYLVSEAQRAALLDIAGQRLKPDAFGRSTVSSIYFDTPDRRIIRDSLEKPLYKEKLRIRSYGTPSDGDEVFLELKKKFDGVVYKRREIMTLRQAKEYVYRSKLPFDSQIMREIDWMRRSYGGLRPAILLSYKREALASEADRGLRITFDDTLLFRTEELALERGPYGRPMLPDGQLIMEIKALGSMPLWLSEALDKVRAYPCSFSKYGTAYTKYILPGGSKCSTHYSNRYSPTASPLGATLYAR